MDSILRFRRLSTKMVGILIIRSKYITSLLTNLVSGGCSMNESCGDCVYFEDRRCIDKVAFCAMLHGPSSVCCLEFEPRNKEIRVNNFNNKFCVDCAHYEDILGISICSRAHRPGIACPAFRISSEALEITA